jgi:spore maturation protein CgeB
MKIVIFGLTISSSWGNGHATLWRGLIRALTDLGWHVVFFEHDVPYYSSTRDLDEVAGGELIIYPDWGAIQKTAQRRVGEADVAVVTSYCPDGIAATQLLSAAHRPLRIFYDLDTPVTLTLLDRGEMPGAVGRDGLSEFDLVLSYVGGDALNRLRTQLGARDVRPLYGHVDPDVHQPAPTAEHFKADLSYIGTYAQDRQEKLDTLLVKAARQRPTSRFIIAGAQYPDNFPWEMNIFFVRHLPPSEHAQFYSSSRLTLNVTRGAMAEIGWCPSGRLFEAAACGAAIISDEWPGLETFFVPGHEILIARTTEDVMAALDMPDADLRRLGANARRRALGDHTSAKRAAQFVEMIERFPRQEELNCRAIPA